MNVCTIHPFSVSASAGQRICNSETIQEAKQGMTQDWGLTPFDNPKSLFACFWTEGDREPRGNSMPTKTEYANATLLELGQRLEPWFQRYEAVRLTVSL